MRERPILFSAPMVRAILDGRKTVTRRIVKMKTHHQIEERDNGTPWPWMYDGERDADSWMACPYGVRGDQLWVRETFAIVPRTAYARDDGVQQVLRPADDHDAAIFRAGWDRSSPGVAWRPSIHMPRWASRITLEVTGVRVEPLNAISNDDAKAEGVEFWRNDGTLTGLPPCSAHRYAFEDLWTSINGADSYNANPWVWVVSFRRLDAKEPSDG